MRSTADKAKLGFQDCYKSSFGYLCQDPQQLNGCLQVSVAITPSTETVTWGHLYQASRGVQFMPRSERYNNVLSCLLTLKQNCEHMHERKRDKNRNHATACTEARGQRAGVSPLLPPHGSQGSS